MPADHRRPAFFLTSLLLLLCTGLLAQTAQILITRELMVVVEGSEHVIGFLLAAWLIWGAVGSAIAGTWIRHLNRRPQTHTTVNSNVMGAWSLWLAAVSLTPALIAVRLARPVFDAPIGTPLPLSDTLLTSLLAPTVPCFALGAAFACLVANRKRMAANVGFGIEALGALIAGCVFVFLLVNHLPPLALSALTALITIIIIAPTLIRHSQTASSARRPVRQGLSLIILLISAGICIAQLCRPTLPDRFTEQSRWASLLPNHRLVSTVETPYGRYAALTKDNQVSIFHDGKLHQTLPDPEAGMVLTHTALLQVSAPVESVLIIGSATSPSARHALEHIGQTGRIDCIDQDEHYRHWRATLEQANQSSAGDTMTDDRVHMHTVDPGQFLDDHQGQYDVVILDMPDPSTIGLDRYYQRHMIQQAHDGLQINGVLCLSVSGEANYLSEPILARNALIYATVRSVFGTSVLASNGDPTLILARKSEPQSGSTVTFDTDSLLTRLGAGSHQCVPYLAFLLADPWPAARVQTVNNELAAWPDALSDSTSGNGSTTAADVLSLTYNDLIVPAANDDAPINSADRPAAYQAHLLATVAKYDPRSMRFINILPRIITCLIAAFWLILAVMVGRNTRRAGSTGHQWGAYASLAAAGFAALGLQMINLMWYQRSLGSLYMDLAVLSGSYMAGLALGSLMASHVKCRHRAVIAGAVCLLVCKAIALWYALSHSETAMVVHMVGIMLSVIGGAALGAHFAAWDAWIAQKQTYRQQKSALVPDSEGAGGVGYAADLLGASVAGLGIAAVIIPAYGYTVGLGFCAAFVLVMLIAPLTEPLRMTGGAQKHTRGTNPGHV